MGERGLKGHSLAPFCLLAFISLRNPWEEPGIESSHKSGQERLPERKLIRWQQ